MALFNPTAMLKGVYQLLQENVALAAVIEGVYSHLPEFTDYPYTHIHIDEIQPYQALQVDAADVRCQITSFSQASTPAEIYSISEIIHEAFLNAGDVFEQVRLVNVQLVRGSFDMLNDGRTHVSSLVFQLIFEGVAP